MAIVGHTGDLHLTDRKQDEYRWDVFPWLRRQAVNRKFDGLWLNGDLTDRKDNHSSTLVNRLIDELRETSKVCPIFINKGNHDYIDHLNPFFKFLDGNKWREAGIRYFVEPTEIKLWGDRYLILPHHHRYKQWWKRYDFPKYDRILIHQAVHGAVMPAGYELEDGAPSYSFKDCKGLVIAGDIHVPQRVGNVVYCGAPYPINFGDDYQPRILVDQDGKLVSVRRHCLRKSVLELSRPEEILGCGLSEGDQVRVTLRIPRSRFVDWESLKAQVYEGAKRLGIMVAGVDLKEAEQNGRVRLQERGQKRHTDAGKTPADWLDRYCREKKVDAGLAAYGRALVVEE